MEIIGWIVVLALVIFSIVQLLCGLVSDIFGILFKVFSDKKHKS